MAEMPAHPRLLISTEIEKSVKERISSDTLSGRLHQLALSDAEEIISKPTCRYDIPDGKRLLRQSRYALENIIHCAWAWRMTGDDKFKKRTIAELDAASRLKDWNTSHFLDTAEMCTAVAIGYDWLFDTLSDEQKARYENAMLNKALLPAQFLFDNNGWWTVAKNNWSQVCSAGISYGAVALADKHPEVCNQLLKQCRELLDSCQVFYEPDGGYPEGPAYWHYGSNYQVLAYAMWDRLGDPMEVPEVVRKSGDFMIHLVGPMRIPFNFADAKARVDLPSPAQSWIARHFRDQGQINNLRQVIENEWPGIEEEGSRLLPLHVLWMPLSKGNVSPPPLGASFHGSQEVATMRTSWEDDAAFMAIKGGTAAASHGHMDIGSFVYDAGGIRWFHDLGSDNYNLPGYFYDNRWDYYRLNSFSHNTLVIGGKMQKEAKAVATLDMAESLDQVTLKLNPAYKGQAASVMRDVQFSKPSGSVHMTDVITQPKGDVRWAAITKAKAKVDGDKVILKRGGKQLVLSRLDQSGGEWEVTAARPQTEKEDDNEGYWMISFTAPQKDSVQLKVEWELSPEA